MSLITQMPPHTPLADHSPAARPPLFSISRKSPYRTDPEALKAYYEDRALMWRNVFFIGIANLGWGLALGIIGPLIILKLLHLGVEENIQGTINTVNTWTVSFLVMLFSWMSDHTVSRLGRRKPYFFISAPFIIVIIVTFPFLAVPRLVWLVLGMYVVYMLFMDLKQSTFSLVMIDCVPRKVLARTNSIFGIIGGITGFLASWYAGRIIELGESVPYLIGGGVMVITTLCALLIKEPPVYHPPSEPFKPWSTFKVAAEDKRIFILMAGVAIIGAYGYSNVLWIWFWSSATLQLSRNDIFQALAWAQIANVVLSYPLGWVIDRFGGLKVVLVYFILGTACFVFQMYVQTKMQLTLLVLAQTMVFPLYAAADIMVYKSSPEKDVGSITSTNACMRNLFGGFFSLLTAWTIYWAGHNYHVGFMIGEIFSGIGMTLFLIHAWTMRKGSRYSIARAQRAAAIAGANEPAPAQEACA